MRAVLNAPAPVMLFDETGRILLLSRAWLRSTGWTSDDMQSIEDWRATASQGDVGTVAAFLHRAIERGAGRQSGDFKFLTKNGRSREWSLVVSALGSLPGGGRLFICIGHDLTAQRNAEVESKNSELRYRQLLEALPAAVYTTDAEGRITFYNKAAVELWGYCPVMGSLWCGSWRLYWADGDPMKHEDCPMAVALREDRPIRGAEAIAERPNGTRVSFIPYPTPLHNTAGELVGGVNMLIDITSRKKAERRLHLLAREVDHRTKNMLAVIQGLVHFTHGETARDFAEAIEGRIMALARAHSLLSNNRWDGADMRTLADQEFESYRDLSSERIYIHGGSITLGTAAAQSIAMIFHELMTNAVKHGALAMRGGKVDVRWHCDEAGRLCFTWAETGGLTIAAPLRKGFGMTLIERTICDQLDGQVRFDWRRKGLVCWFRIPATAGSHTQFCCEAEAMA